MIFSRVAACIDGLWGNGLSGGMNMLSKIKKSWTTRKNIRGRSGSMLLLVLIIMAVAVILFASALMIADASRLRYYKSAEQEQASLTAMSAAKLIGTAATNGKITVSDLEYMAEHELTVQVSSINIPGLSDTINSKTSAKFDYSDETEKYISITVTTVLNVLNAEISSAGSSEVATVLLERITPESKPFTNLITMGIDDPSNQIKFIINKFNDINNLQILTTADDGDDGYVVVNGDVNFQYDFLHSPEVDCDIVFTGDVRVQGHDNIKIFYGNVVLYGDDASIIKESAPIKIGGNLFFFRKALDYVFTEGPSALPTEKNGPSINVTKGVYLLNSKLNAQYVTFNTVDTGIVFEPPSTVNNATGKVAIDPFKTSLTTEANSLYDKLSIAASRKVLTTEDAKSLFPYKTGSLVKAAPGLQKILITGGTGLQQFAIGSYYIDLGSNSLANPELSQNLTFDLAKGNCTLYIIDTQYPPFNFHHDLLVTGSIKFINGGSGAIGKILLLDGADMTLGREGYNARYAYITGITEINETQKGTPFLFIFGLGEKESDNPLLDNPNVISLVNGDIEAFIGLYGTKGKLQFTAHALPLYPGKVKLYVRYEGAFIDDGYVTQDFPYCPPPAEGALNGLGSSNSVTYQSAGYIVGPAT